MALKLENGVYALGPGGLPETVEGLDALLQNAAMRLRLPTGAFPYDRSLGTGLSRLSGTEEHAEALALSLANEALLGMPGVRAVSAAFSPEGALSLTLETPLGPGTVRLG